MNGLVQALFQMVWSDNIVSPEEVSALTVVLRKMRYSLPEVICLLDENLSEPPEEAPPLMLDHLFETREEQKKALEALMTICFSTGSIGPEQIGFIEGLVVRMGLTAQELEQLRQNAMKAGKSC
jgi:hypothetical protein